MTNSPKIPHISEAPAPITVKRPRVRTLPLLALSIPILLTAALILTNKLRGPSDHSTLRPIADRSDFSLSLPTLAGPTWNIADHRGKVLLINIFATWCPPCDEEMPDLVQIAHDYAPRGVDIAAISADDDQEASTGRIPLLQQYAADRHLPFPILLPAHPETFQDGIPRTFLIDRHGRLAHFTFGRFDPAHLRSLLDQLLKEP